MKWFNEKSRISSQLPWPFRVWVRYMQMAPKRSNGGAVGGSIVFRIAASFFRLQQRALRASETCVLSGDHRVTPRLLAVNPSDFEVMNHTIDLWQNECSEKRLLRAIASDAIVFMDIGSNHGCYALLAGALHPKNLVFAFEPQPKVAEALRISVSANSFKNVTVVETVISDTVGDCTFFCPKTGSGICSLSRAQAEQSVSAIELTRISTTIDQFVRNHNLQQLDVIKVDVEGFEYQVFRGASETLRKHRPIIWFEMNASALRRTGTSQEAVYSLLREFNYRWFYDVSTLHQTPRQLDGQVEQVTNILAIPDGKEHTLENLFHQIQQQLSL